MKEAEKAAKVRRSRGQVIIEQNILVRCTCTVEKANTRARPIFGCACVTEIYTVGLLSCGRQEKAEQMKADATRKLKEAEEATKVGRLIPREIECCSRVVACVGFCWMMGKGGIDSDIFVFWLLPVLLSIVSRRRQRRPRRPPRR